jgi:hypothetical protein
VGAMGWRGTGARKDPPPGGWTPVPEAAPRIPRGQHVAGWTGEELLIWGGYDGYRERGDGAAFRP